MYRKALQAAMICLTVTFLLEFMPSALDAIAAEMSPRQNTYRQGVERGLGESLGMPILKGDLWQKMTHDEKVAFIWGFGHVVSIEQYLMERHPDLKRESFIAKVVEGMANTPMAEVVITVDKYYETNPGEIDKPVTSVLWDTMIRPNIKTGIAGRPLRNK